VIEGMPPTCTNQTVPYGTALLRVALSQALRAQATIAPSLRDISQQAPA
jgi:hypothetical protein